MEEKIKEILKSNALTLVPAEEISLKTDLPSLGLNSITFIKLIVAIEREFDIEFEEEELDFGKVKNLEDVVNYITSKIDNKEVN